MSLGTIVVVMVLVETALLLLAVRWLLTGLRSERADWPPIRPLGATPVPPAPREPIRAEEPVAVS